MPTLRSAVRNGSQPHTPVAAPIAASIASSSSGSSRSSSSSSDSDSSSSDEDDDNEPSPPAQDDDEVEALFAASVAAHQAALVKAAQQASFTDDQDVIRLTADSAAPAAVSTTALKGKGKADSDTTTASAAAQKTREDTALERHLARLANGEVIMDVKKTKTKAALRAAREKSATTAGKGWFDMPAFPGAATSKGSGMSTVAGSTAYVGSARGPTAEEMRREVQAIRLRNAMDPKRFYKGGKGDKGMPKFAQLGRIIGSELEPASVLTNPQRGRSVVEEVVRDAEAAAYAKRKFAEQQERSASGGRGHAKAKSKKQKRK